MSNENEPTAGDYVDMLVRITNDSVYIGAHKIPGCIEDGGVIVRPGGSKDINRLTVTFLVGEIHVEDAFSQPAPKASANHNITTHNVTDAIAEAQRQQRGYGLR